MPPAIGAKPETPVEAEPETEAAPEAEAPPPALGEVPTPAVKGKKKAKSEEQKTAEAEDLRQAALDREDLSPKERSALNRVQKIAKQWVKNNPVLHKLSAHRYLNNEEQFPDWVKTKEHIGKHFGEVNQKLDYSKDEHQETAATALLHDVMHALAGKSSAYDWYDRTVDKSLRHISRIAPKILSDPEHALAFKLATAITSQGQDVFPNFESGYMAYRHWAKTGKMPVDPALFGKGEVGGGAKNPAMIANFQKVNELWGKHGYDKFKKLLETPISMRELRDEYGIKLGGESPDHEMEGAALLGPKIGSFFNNLNKRFHSVTFDLWASRTLNRMAGNMLKFSQGKMLDKVTKKGEQKLGHLSKLENLINSGQIQGADTADQKAMLAEIAKLRGMKTLTREAVLKHAPGIADWAEREHGRYAKGTGGRSYPPELKHESTSLAKNFDLNLTDLADAPRGPKQRKQWRQIFGKLQDKLTDAGIDMSHANSQATLWYLEQRLFRKAGSRNRASFDYLDAAHRLVRKVKSGDLPSLREEEPIPVAA
jgi:hypothetical protein